MIVYSDSGTIVFFNFCKKMAKIRELVKMHVWAGYDFVVY